MAVDKELDQICAEFAEHAKTCPMCGENSASVCAEGLKWLQKLGEIAARPEAA